MTFNGIRYCFTYSNINITGQPASTAAPLIVVSGVKQFAPIASSVLRGFSSLTCDQAIEHAWPGNVRELRNRVERACALTTGEWVMPYDLFPDATPGQISKPVSFVTLSEARDDAERRQIERALAKTSGRISEAAKLLEVSRTTLWDKMRRFGIHADHTADSSKL